MKVLKINVSFCLLLSSEQVELINSTRSDIILKIYGKYVHRKVYFLFGCIALSSLNHRALWFKHASASLNIVAKVIKIWIYEKST